MSRMIATLCGLGHIGFAPGTFGSLAAVILGYGIFLLFGGWGLVAGCLVSFWVGLWATEQLTAGQTDHDPSYIIIDEVAGQWVALLPLAYGLSPFEDAPLLALLLAFALFRFFDILKPPPVSWADRKDTSMGVMLDDVLAGLLSTIVIVALYFTFNAQ
jgi:phosphatidylglycerophosphatase A